MFVIIGAALVIIGVIGGFMLEGGPLLVLFQWKEFLIIGGAGIGSLLIQTPIPVLKQMVQRFSSLLKPSPVH